MARQSSYSSLHVARPSFCRLDRPWPCSPRRAPFAARGQPLRPLDRQRRRAHKLEQAPHQLALDVLVVRWAAQRRLSRSCVRGCVVVFGPPRSSSSSALFSKSPFFLHSLLVHSCVDRVPSFFVFVPPLLVLQCSASSPRRLPARTSSRGSLPLLLVPASPSYSSPRSSYLPSKAVNRACLCCSSRRWRGCAACLLDLAFKARFRLAGCSLTAPPLSRKRNTRTDFCK